MAHVVDVEGKKYWRDAKGSLVAEENVKPEDKKRDRLVERLIKKAEGLAEKIAKEKEEFKGIIDEYLHSQAEKHGTEWKGNTQLKSYDSRLRVDIRVNEQLTFDERLQIAKSLIDECLREWSVDSNPALATLVEKAFNTDKKGTLDRNFILKLRSYKITAKTKQQDWNKAMELIADSVQVESTKVYYLFKRQNEKGEWENINLDFSN